MIDLHLHSTASDGTDPPKEVVRRAAALGLTAIAVSDHDSVEGVDEALAVGKIAGVEVVPAVEMSSEADGTDVHFLGYFIDHKDPKLLDSLAALRMARYERARVMVERLKELGVDLRMEDVLAEAGEGAVGRAHVARALLATGKVASLEEAFSKYLARERPAYVSKRVADPKDVIEIIHGVGGIASLAHPGVNGAERYVDEFVSYGLDAIEVYHYEHTPQQTADFIELAREKGLLVTGGSDCHGSKSTRGMTMGSVKVPDSVLEALK